MINMPCEEHVKYQVQTSASVPTLYVALGQTKASMSNSRTNPHSRRNDVHESVRQANELQCESEGIPIKQCLKFGICPNVGVTLQLELTCRGAR